MRIMVFDVPANIGGALSILNEFHTEVKSCVKEDIEWFFILSEPFLEETKNIRVLRYPWIKKSWIHRIYFDQIIAPKLVKQYNVDKIFSLQNIVVPRVAKKQILYIHQSLPFVNYKFKFKENKLFWIYQNIISLIIYSSMKKAVRVIVQTEWMKKACIEKGDISDNKIIVVPPKLHIKVDKVFKHSKNSLITFFYPASSSYYKNHRIIVEACEHLVRNNNLSFNIIFTLKGDEDKHIESLYKKVQSNNLPIEFIGNISKEEVYEYYTKTFLVFPSYVETYGLPLLECRLHEGIIIAADTEFSKEVLRGYEKALYFDPFDSNSLTVLLEKAIMGELNFRKSDDNIKNPINKSLLTTIIED